jgi:mannose-6-phosphate isomerase-like protein (cupin superfamily)
MIKIIEKPWGSETIWAHTNEYVGKILRVSAGCSLSTQYHIYKDETMYVLSGRGVLNLYTMDEDGSPRLQNSIDFCEGMAYNITPTTIHSLEAVTDLMVLEASTNHLTDIVRLYDIYGRT